MYEQFSQDLNVWGPPSSHRPVETSNYGFLNQPNTTAPSVNHDYSLNYSPYRNNDYCQVSSNCTSYSANRRVYPLDFQLESHAQPNSNVSLHHMKDTSSKVDTSPFHEDMDLIEKRTAGLNLSEHLPLQGTGIRHITSSYSNGLPASTVLQPLVEKIVSTGSAATVSSWASTPADGTKHLKNRPGVAGSAAAAPIKVSWASVASKPAKPKPKPNTLTVVPTVTPKEKGFGQSLPKSLTQQRWSAPKTSTGL